MQYEKINVFTRAELILRIKALLDANGWQTFLKSEQTLYATDSLGGGVTLNFEAYHDDPSYGRALRASAYACKTIDNTKNYNEQDTSEEIAYFQFNKPNINGAEFGGGYIFADDKTLIIALDIIKYRQVVIIFSNLTKSHEFGGGRVCYASAVTSSYEYGHSENYKHSSYLPFGYGLGGQKTAFFLGGEWQVYKRVQYRSGYGEYKTDFRKVKFITNLLQKNTNAGRDDFNPLNALSAKDFLDYNRAKSSASGLRTLITPNFFYKNNENHFVYAGALDCVRVFNEYGNLYENGTILHLGSEKFLIFRPHENPGSTSQQYNYSLAVKIV